MPRLAIVIAAMLIAAPDDRHRTLLYPNDLAKWVVTWSPRNGYTRQWVTSAKADYHWHVFLRRGTPSARLSSRDDPFSPPLPFVIKKGKYTEGDGGRRLNIKVEDGWIVSFNGGEWGAGLWWFSPDGTRRYNISLNIDWINGYFPTDAGLLALSGITHGGTRGQIIRLARGRDGRWRSEVFIPLGEEPCAAVKDADGTLVVVTHGRLLRIHPATKEVDVLIPKAFWVGLYPKSVVLAGGKIFVGMRHGVARIEKRGRIYHSDWLLPTPDFARRPPASWTLLSPSFWDLDPANRRKSR